MTDYVYILSGYEGDSYSYNGVSVYDQSVHRTREGAVSRAALRGWTVTTDPTEPGHATIDREELLD